MIKPELLTEETLSNGNVVFSYKMVKHRDTKWIIIPFLILYLVILLSELIDAQTAYYQVICLPILIIILWNWFRVSEKRNEKLEKIVIYKNLDQIIKRDAQSFGDSIIELSRNYHNYTPSKYTSPTQRTVTVLLSNGKELTYNIINEKYSNGIILLEIDIHHDKTRN